MNTYKVIGIFFTLLVIAAIIATYMEGEPGIYNTIKSSVYEEAKINSLINDNAMLLSLEFVNEINSIESISSEDSSKMIDSIYVKTEFDEISESTSQCVQENKLNLSELSNINATTEVDTNVKQ
jgi:hypothetical protein